MGYFIEVISGMPFDEFLRKRMFEPMGMSDTYFYLPDNKASRLVSIQKSSKDGGFERYPTTFYDPEYPIKGAKTFFGWCGAFEYRQRLCYFSPNVYQRWRNERQKIFEQNHH
ncbi:MAG: serine hydrolase [Arcicella sp.]|nr:serine hydrolase [Arcicella sp.]